MTPSPRFRLAMMALNALPLAQVALIGTAAWAIDSAWAAGLAAAGLLYLPPPLAARVVLRLRPIRSQRIAAGSGDFLTWWALACLQTLFARFPVLEEALRLVPGAYSAWLRLWGARIGRLTYWAPGVAILDRSFLRIGDDVVFGAGVRLNPHVIAEDATGATELLLADVVIGDGCVVGGYSLLTAGTELRPGERSRAMLASPPFSVWAGGRRVRERPDGDRDAD